MSAAFWACALVSVASALTSFGFSLAAAASSTGRAETNALYACARSGALALVSVVALVARSRPWVEALALLMTLVQLGDAFVGRRTRDALTTYGPGVTALANLGTLIWLFSAAS